MNENVVRVHLAFKGQVAESLRELAIQRRRTPGSLVSELVAKSIEEYEDELWIEQILGRENQYMGDYEEYHGRL